MWIFKKNYHSSLQSGKLCWETKYKNTVNLGVRKMPTFRLWFLVTKAEWGSWVSSLAEARGEPGHPLAAPLCLCSSPRWRRGCIENGHFWFYLGGLFFSWIGSLSWFTKQPFMPLCDIPKWQRRGWQGEGNMAEGEWWSWMGISAAVPPWPWSSAQHRSKACVALSLTSAQGRSNDSFSQTSTAACCLK